MIRLHLMRPPCRLMVLLLLAAAAAAVILHSLVITRAGCSLPAPPSDTSYSATAAAPQQVQELLKQVASLKKEKEGLVSADKRLRDRVRVQEQQLRRAITEVRKEAGLSAGKKGTQPKNSKGRRDGSQELLQLLSKPKEARPAWLNDWLTQRRDKLRELALCECSHHIDILTRACRCHPTFTDSRCQALAIFGELTGTDSESIVHARFG